MMKVFRNPQLQKIASLEILAVIRQLKEVIMSPLGLAGSDLNAVNEEAQGHQHTDSVSGLLYDPTDDSPYRSMSSVQVSRTQSPGSNGCDANVFGGAGMESVYCLTNLLIGGFASKIGPAWVLQGPFSASCHQDHWRK